MEDLYVHDCPYSKLVGDACIWDFTTMAIHRSAFFLGSKPTRKRLEGVYRVITADNTMMTIELREDKLVSIRTNEGTCRGTWGIRMAWNGKAYARENVVCGIRIESDLIKGKYNCIFERDGVMILVPIKADKTAFARRKDSYDYSKCLFLVKEQRGEKRPQSIEMFTAFVKETYLSDATDKEISSAIKPGLIRWLCFLPCAVVFMLLFVKGLSYAIEGTTLNSLYSQNPNIAMGIIIVPALFLTFITHWLNAKFEDMRISITKSYAKNFRTTHSEYEIPDMSHKWSAIYNTWSGEWDRI